MRLVIIEEYRVADELEALEVLSNCRYDEPDGKKLLKQTITVHEEEGEA